MERSETGKEKRSGPAAAARKKKWSHHVRCPGGVSKPFRVEVRNRKGVIT